VTHTWTFFLERLIQFPLCFGTSVACSFARFWFFSSDFNIRRYWTETNYFLPVLSCVGIPIKIFLKLKTKLCCWRCCLFTDQECEQELRDKGEMVSRLQAKATHISHILANLEQCPASSTWSTNSFPTTTISTSTTTTTTSTSIHGVRPSENDKSCAHSSHRFFWKIYQLLVYGPVHHLPIFFFFGRIVRPGKNRENWRAVLKVGSIWKIPGPIREKRWF